MKPGRLLDTRIVQNFHLVWLDENIDEVNNNDYRNSITKFRQIVNTVNTFIDVDQCMDFITDYKEEKAFMVISSEFSQIAVPIIQNISQVSSVYIFCENKVHFEKWAQQWSKIKGVYTDIASICEALQQDAHDCEQNSISISIVKPTAGVSNQSLDTLDSSFMYTQILKEILLTIDFQQIHFNEFVTYCREQFVGNPKELKNVDKIEEEYPNRRPIWWYTYNCFLYSMLNRTLRTMEIDLIIKMGFFVRDLHNHIAELHTEQYGGQRHSSSFTVYRGQGLSQIDFDQLKETQGGLLAFNNFLSTSDKYGVSLRFARRAINTFGLVGVLFLMKIDPSISKTPFANVKNVSCYQREEEILFSMHSVFRIGQVKQIDENDRLWQVELTLTNDNDPQLQALTKHIQAETFSYGQGWTQLGMLLMKLAHFNKAEELYEILLKQSTTEGEKGYLYNMFGMIKDAQGEYTKATEYYEKSITIIQKILPANHPSLAASYNNIGMLYLNMGDYSKALSSYDKALEIRQKTLPPNHPDLAASYNNIGTVYDSMSEYSKALSSYTKALEMRQKTLPPNHPDLATSYNNIGAVYDSMSEYSKALSYYEKTFEILKKTLPANHPSLATSYNNIGLVYDHMCEYSKALSSFEKALEMRQKTLPSNHPDLATSYNNIGLVYENMREYLKALSYYEKALEIKQKTLPENHPDLATFYNNIGGAYQNMGEYSDALSSYKKALEILKKTLPANHHYLVIFYNNTGSVYDSMGEYSKALSYYENALEIGQQTLPAKHPNLATSYNKIGNVYYNMSEYSKALSFYEKALEILRGTLSTNHRELATSYNNIGIVYKSMGEYSKALSYIERALDILQRLLPPNHPDLKSVKDSIEIVKKKL
jgi:tetratricopeptide (TPR) repeat protein